MPSQLLDERAAAAYLGVSVGLMRRWRLLKQGPTYRKLGDRLVRYGLEDLHAFVNEGRIEPAG